MNTQISIRRLNSASRHVSLGGGGAGVAAFVTRAF